MYTRVVFAGALLLAAIEPLQAKEACSRLAALSLPHTTITSAVVTPEGTIPLPAAFGNAQRADALRSGLGGP